MNPCQTYPRRYVLAIERPGWAGEKPRRASWVRWLDALLRALSLGTG